MIRVFIGAGEDERVPALVLMASILRHRKRSDSCPEDVSVILIGDEMERQGIEMPVPRDKHNRQVTAFSFQRFVIPQLCEFRGNAIYLDSDMIVLGDIVEVWRSPIPYIGGGQANVCNTGSWQSAVSLWRCDGFRHTIADLVSMLDNGLITYRSLMNLRVSWIFRLAPTVPKVWNCMDARPAGAKLVHYTTMNSQPWLRPGHPLGGLWFKGLTAAIREGVVTPELLRRHVAERRINPYVLSVLGDHVDADAVVSFVPPHKRRSR